MNERTITKTATSTNQDPATGDWTITYDIVVNLAANPENLSAEYDLEDTLEQDRVRVAELATEIERRLG